MTEHDVDTRLGGQAAGRVSAAEKRGDEDAKKPKDINIEVNGRLVAMTSKEATGAQIKQAAIAQGVPIQPNFVLQQELANGSSRLIGDTDEVRLHEKLSFTAIAPDDNS
jgi:hypothetical protein